MKNQENYIELCVKFFTKEITDSELSWLNNWLSESAENKQKFNKVSELWYSRKYSQFDTDKAWETIQQRILNERRHQQPANTVLIPRMKLIYWAVAASLIVLLSVPTLMYYFTNSVESSDDVLFTVTAPKGEKALVLLGDGSRVWLNGGSSLKYSNEFNQDKRHVMLNGEGFFEIAKNEAKPFTVGCNETEVKVLGTSFNVSNYQNDDFIQLTLVTGKLSFTHDVNQKATILAPSQQLTYQKDTRKLSVVNTETELYTLWKDNQLKFDNAPFIDVIKKMERWYDVDIELEEQMQNSEKYTMTVKTESLREILHMLRLTTAFDYKIDKEKVYIYNRKKKKTS